MFKLRNTNASDLDAITWIALAALPADPVNPYRFPHADRYPDDFAHFTRIRYGEYLADSDNVVMVYECPSIEDPSTLKPVAFSIWQLPPTQRPSSKQANNATAQLDDGVKKSPPDRLHRRDADAARVLAYRAALGVAKKELFDDRFRDTQLYLGMLACHPDYQRRGAGEELVRWGLEKAKKEGLDVTLFASPMGERLYKRLGFLDIGRFRSQVPGEEEYVDQVAMVLEQDRIV